MTMKDDIAAILRTLSLHHNRLEDLESSRERYRYACTTCRGTGRTRTDDWTQYLLALSKVIKIAEADGGNADLAVKAVPDKPDGPEYGLCPGCLGSKLPLPADLFAEYIKSVAGEFLKEQSSPSGETNGD